MKRAGWGDRCLWPVLWEGGGWVGIWVCCSVGCEVGIWVLVGVVVVDRWVCERWPSVIMAVFKALG